MGITARGGITLDFEGGISSINSLEGAITITGTDGSVVVTTSSPTINLSTAETEIDDGNSGTADTIDFSIGRFHKSTLTGNVTYTFTAPPRAQEVILRVVQGSGPFTTTWPATVTWPGGVAPKLTQTSGQIDVFSFYYDGAKYRPTGISFNESP